MDAVRGGGHDADLFAVGTDDAHFRVADLFIDLQVFVGDGKAPPKMS